MDQVSGALSGAAHLDAAMPGFLERLEEVLGGIRRDIASIEGRLDGREGPWRAYQSRKRRDPSQLSASFLYGEVPMIQPLAWTDNSACFGSLGCPLDIMDLSRRNRGPE